MAPTPARGWAALQLQKGTKMEIKISLEEVRGDYDGVCCVNPIVEIDTANAYNDGYDQFVLRELEGELRTLLARRLNEAIDSYQNGMDEQAACCHGYADMKPFVTVRMSPDEWREYRGELPADKSTEPPPEV